MTEDERTRVDIHKKVLPPPADCDDLRLRCEYQISEAVSKICLKPTKKTDQKEWGIGFISSVFKEIEK